MKLRVHVEETEESIASRENWHRKKWKKSKTKNDKCIPDWGLQEDQVGGENIFWYQCTYFSFFLIGNPLKTDTALPRYQLAFSPVPFYIFLLLHTGHTSKVSLLTRMIHKLFKCQGSMAEEGMRKRKCVGAPGIWQLDRGVEGSEWQDQGCKWVKYIVQNPGMEDSGVRHSHSLGGAHPLWLKEMEAGQGVDLIYEDSSMRGSRTSHCSETEQAWRFLTRYIQSVLISKALSGHPGNQGGQ